MRLWVEYVFYTHKVIAVGPKPVLEESFYQSPDLERNSTDLHDRERGKEESFFAGHFFTAKDKFISDIFFSGDYCAQMEKVESILITIQSQEIRGSSLVNWKVQWQIELNGG